MDPRWTSVCLSVRPSICRTSVRISFPDDNLSKHQLILTKFGMHLILLRSGFGLLIIMCQFRQFRQFLRKSYLPATRLYFRFRTIT